MNVRNKLKQSTAEQSTAITDWCCRGPYNILKVERMKDRENKFQGMEVNKQKDGVWVSVGGEGLGGGGGW